MDKFENYMNIRWDMFDLWNFLIWFKWLCWGKVNNFVATAQMFANFRGHYKIKLNTYQ